MCVQKYWIVMVDRSYNMFVVHLSIDDAYYNGTIFDGELVQGAPSTFHIFDCLSFCGQPLWHRDFPVRLGVVKANLQPPEVSLTSGANVSVLTFLEAVTAHNTYYCYCPDRDPFRMVVSMPISKDEAEDLIFNAIASSTPLDGLILQPAAEPYLRGLGGNLFKYKYGEQGHTIDFLSEHHGGEIDLCLLGKDRRRFRFTTIRLTLDEKDRLGAHDLASLHNAILECAYSKRTDTWYPIKKRTDKFFPNNEITLQRTMRNIEEDIQFVDLMYHLTDVVLIK